MKSRRWTDAEKAFLTENYAQLGVAACARYLGRTDASVRNAACLYGVRRATRSWTTRDRRTLAELYGTIPNARLADILGRSVPAVVQAAAAVGVANGEKFWTTGDDAVLLRYWGVESAHRIARRLGRAYDAIHRRVARLRATGVAIPSLRPRQWTPADDAVIVRDFGPLTLAQIGAELGRTRAAVAKRAARLRRMGVKCKR